MQLTIWILESDLRKRQQLETVWQSLAEVKVNLRSFDSLDALLQAGSKEPQLPDLIMGDCFSGAVGAQGIQLLRALGPVDLFPVTESRSVSAFTLSQRCGIIDYVLQPCSRSRLRSGIRRYLKLRRMFSLSVYEGKETYALRQKDLDPFFFPSDRRLPTASASVLTRELPTGSRERIPLILAHLQSSAGDGSSAADLAAALQVSRSCMLKDLTFLLEEGYIQKRSAPTGRPGRPADIYYLRSTEP